MSREILKSYLSTEMPVLEIGPLDKPFIAKSEFNVYYADINDEDHIKAVFADVDDIDCDAVQDIDFVVKESYKKAVCNERFQAVFSSHVIEHVPDIVRHFIEISEILMEEGLFILAIPDKRYTFDRFREVTPFRDAHDVYVGGTRNTARLAFDFRMNCHPSNDPIEHKLNNLSFQTVALDENSVLAAIKLYDSVKNSETLDSEIHFWVFTYPSFLAFLRDIIRCRLFPYSLEYSDPPKGFSVEFHIVLKKDLEVLNNEEKRKAEIEKLTELIESYETSLVTMDHKVFINKYQLIYIYGAGGYAGKCFSYLQAHGITVSGFIVSDGQEKPDNLL